MDDSEFYRRLGIPEARRFCTASTEAYKYLKEDRSDPQDTVSAIYAVNGLEYHASVVGIDDHEGELTHFSDERGEIQLHDMCQSIPISETKHIWGHIVWKYIYWHEGTGYLRFGKRQLIQKRNFKTNRTWTVLPDMELSTCFTFHSQPSNDFYGDIPSVEDIFIFLRYRHLEHVVVGRTSCTIFKKAETILPAIISLYDWEQEHKYQRARLQKRHPSEPGHEEENELEIEHRYITIALRHIGLRWPTKLSARRKVWRSAIERLGIAVSQVPRY